MMIIGKPVLAAVGQFFEYRVNVEMSGRERTLWYRLPLQFSSMVSERADAAVVALIIPAMAQGGKLKVGGRVSERLFYNLSRSYGSVLGRMLPGLSSVDLQVEDLEASTAHVCGVATGFSGGIDSFSLLAGHLNRSTPESFKITHLLFNNVGSHGLESSGAALFQERYRRLLPATEELGLPFIPVDSNLAEFYDGFTFQQTHTPRNASVALLLQNGIGRMLYASTFGYTDTKVSPTYDIAYADPISLPLLSTETMDIIAGDTHLSRVDKTLLTAKTSLAQRYLDVCVMDGARNCSHCWKCMRTMLTLDIAGQLPLFADVFDIPLYFNLRSTYLLEVASSTDPLLREVAAFADEEGVKLPKIRGSAIAFGRKVRGIAKTLAVGS